MTSSTTSQSLSTHTSRRMGVTIHAHTLTVPTFHSLTDQQKSEGGVQAVAHPSNPTSLTIFARELVPDGGENFPALLYFQGGPGFPSPRPVTISGWIQEALKHYRVILLDQRGTGNSTPIYSSTLEQFGDSAQAQANYLSAHRADSIVQDAELLRHALAGHRGEEPQPWSVLGQSFGGFCITSYLSLAPQGLREVFFTGGLPALDTSAQDIYRETYQLTAHRQEEFFEQFPSAHQSIANILDYLADKDTAEYLLTGEKLTPERFRTLGMNLGRGVGFDTLGYLLENPWDQYKHLNQQFIRELTDQLSFAGHPLYAVLHESIYAGATPALSDTPTAWAAEEVLPTPLSESQLTGEHIYPWQFDQDPALIPFKEVADILAQKDDWPILYSPTVLTNNTVPAAAAIYVDDMFVPYSYSLQTAQNIKGLRPYITNLYQHSGLGDDGATIFSQLRTLLLDHA